MKTIKNKKNILKGILILISTIICITYLSCGSTWEIKGNSFKILNKKIENDSTKEQMGEILQKTMEYKNKNTERITQ